MRCTLALVALLLAGCGEMSSYAVPTTNAPVAPRTGSVALYLTRPPPDDAREVGIVEVRGIGKDAAVETLLPELVRRAAQLGANALVVDFLGAKTEGEMLLDTRTAILPCGPTVCTRFEQVPEAREVFVVVLRGRAFVTGEPRGANGS